LDLIEGIKMQGAGGHWPCTVGRESLKGEKKLEFQTAARTYVSYIEPSVAVSVDLQMREPGGEERGRGHRRKTHPGKHSRKKDTGGGAEGDNRIGTER